MPRKSKWVVVFWDCPESCGYRHSKIVEECGGCGTKRPKQTMTVRQALR